MPQGLSLADFKAVLFDIDGTLVNTLPTIILGLGDAYEHFSGVRPADEQILETIGSPLREQMQMYTDAILSPEEIEERVEYTVRCYQNHSELEQEFEPAVGALQWLISCGFKTALVTSKNALEISLFQQRFPWVADVDTVVCASDVQHAKPDPESALLACERLGVRPEEAVFIGDSVFDMLCARRAGNATIAVGYGAGKTAALRSVQPDKWIDTPEELATWVNETILRTPCLEKRT